MSMYATTRRRYTVVRQVSEMGRSRVTIVCPFCEAHVVAYLWSLAGSGKRCVCRALFTRSGEAHAAAPRGDER